MKQTRSKKQQQIEWRRNKIDELTVKGFSQSEIARMLEIDKSIVSKDISFLKEEAKETIKNHIQERLPYEYKKCISGLEEIIKEGWIIATTANKNGDSKEHLSSLALIKDTYSTKMDLLTNASLLQDSIKFVSETKENLSNKKEDIDQDKEIGLERSAEVNNDTTEKEQQHNQVF
jgi:predicted transcriptional regulator